MHTKESRPSSYIYFSVSIQVILLDTGFTFKSLDCNLVLFSSGLVVNTFEFGFPLAVTSYFIPSDLFVSVVVDPLSHVCCIGKF